MEKIIERWEHKGPFTAAAFDKLCKKLIDSGENSEYQLMDSLRDRWDMFPEEEIAKLYEMESKHPYIRKALDGKVKHAYESQNLTCIMCDAPFQQCDSNEYGLCDTCSENDKEILCSYHLEECEVCSQTGCHGCGTVDTCRLCYVSKCEECMGNGACSECQNLYYCEECLKDNGGKCEHCSE